MMTKSSTLPNLFTLRQIGQSLALIHTLSVVEKLSEVNTAVF